MTSLIREFVPDKRKLYSSLIQPANRAVGDFFYLHIKNATARLLRAVALSISYERRLIIHELTDL